MTKTLLVLGASSDQVFMIKTAKRMGLHVLAVDMNPDSPGFAWADRSAVVSTRDVPGLLRLVERERSAGRRIDGVTTMGSDIPDVVARVAQALGTPGPSHETARWATDKYAMKIRFRECGIPIPWFECVESEAQFLRTIEDRGLPAVLKPVDRSGSRGVFLLEEGCDLRALFRESVGLSHSGRCLVEEYLPGPQISTETVMWQGQGVTPGFADRNYELLARFRPRFMENGGWVPSCVTRDERCAVESLVERAARALGVEDGVAKGDVVLTPAGPKMIEMAARLSGGDFCESLVPLGTGVNYVEAVIRIALGENPRLDLLEPLFDRCVANRYFFAPPGRLREVKDLDAIRAQDWVEKLEFWYEPGDSIPEPTSHAQRLGVVVVTGADRAEVASRVRWVYETLAIEVDPLTPSRATENGVGQRSIDMR